MWSCFGHGIDSAAKASRCRPLQKAHPWMGSTRLLEAKGRVPSLDGRNPNEGKAEPEASATGVEPDLNPTVAPNFKRYPRRRTPSHSWARSDQVSQLPDPQHQFQLRVARDQPEARRPHQARIVWPPRVGGRDFGMMGRSPKRVCTGQKAMASVERFSNYDYASPCAVMRILTAPWILIVCCAMCEPLHAIDPDRRLDQLYHTAWTAKDGAPTDVRTWAETPDGFLWFGNNSGLFRFDGARFERYDVLSGAAMPQASVSALTTLADGSLLIGWGLGGVSRLKNGEFKDYGGPGSGYPANATLSSFQKGGDGTLWALVAYQGMFRLDRERTLAPNWIRIALPLEQADAFLCRPSRDFMARQREDKHSFCAGGKRLFRRFRAAATR